MRVLLVGYGKMGLTIEKILIKRGHNVVGVIDSNNSNDVVKYSSENTDVAIEFTQPASAFRNISSLVRAGVKVVSGTTAWLDQKPEVDKITIAEKGGFLYASNFSIGVNLFFHINEMLAKLMNTHTQYDVKIDEIHHTQKKDAPSGTALSLYDGVVNNLDRKSDWELEKASSPNVVRIDAIRSPHVPGTHKVSYSSDIDTIDISHTAHTREGFALGAVIAAEWIADKVGVFDMSDVLKVNG